MCKLAQPALYTAHVACAPHRIAPHRIAPYAHTVCTLAWRGASTCERSARPALEEWRCTSVP